MSAACPQCTDRVEMQRSVGGILSGWLKEYYHCDRCRITIMVEYQILPDPPESGQAVLGTS